MYHTIDSTDNIKKYHAKSLEELEDSSPFMPMDSYRESSYHNSEEDKEILYHSISEEEEEEKNNPLMLDEENEEKKKYDEGEDKQEDIKNTRRESHEINNQKFWNEGIEPSRKSETDKASHRRSIEDLIAAMQQEEKKKVINLDKKEVKELK